MKIAISADSAIDLSKELLEKYNIHTTPFTFLLGDKQYYDGEMTNEEIFSIVSNIKSLPKTSAVNEYQFEEHFGGLLKDYDAVIHFSLSSGVSSAYNNAVSVAKKIENVYVIDTKSLSGGIACLAIKTHQLINEGKSLQEILAIVEKIKNNIQVSLVLNKLDYLRKGGRCSGIVCFGANLLQIHPQIIVKDGSLTVGKKFRGNFDHCVKLYTQDILSTFNNYDKSIVFLAYTTISDEAKNIAREELVKAGFENIIELSVGATISSHCGPNAMGILYMTKNDIF